MVVHAFNLCTWKAEASQVYRREIRSGKKKSTPVISIVQESSECTNVANMHKIDGACGLCREALKAFFFKASSVEVVC